ncbi:hypothetical protein IAD21_04737 [Abditibacteriota bacterium]|nr:hypothetical protein IAD21_04737 [Abditibacteriota bacterium]
MVKPLIIAMFFIPAVVFLGWVIMVAAGALRSEHRERLSPTTFNPNRAYVNWTPRDGWPRGPFLHYECTLCGGVVPSKSRSTQCQCGNVSADGERIGVKDVSKVRLFEERPENNPNPVPDL